MRGDGERDSKNWMMGRKMEGRRQVKKKKTNKKMFSRLSHDLVVIRQREKC